MLSPFSSRQPLSTPCMKVSIGMHGSATEVFSSIFNLPPPCRTGIVKTIRVVETIDNYTDVVHIVLEPVYLEPSWTLPRDFCLMRYWRQNSCGSYIVCLDSIFHQDCPLVPGQI